MTYTWAEWLLMDWVSPIFFSFLMIGAMVFTLIELVKWMIGKLFGSTVEPEAAEAELARRSKRDGE